MRQQRFDDLLQRVPSFDRQSHLLNPSPGLRQVQTICTSSFWWGSLANESQAEARTVPSLRRVVKPVAMRRVVASCDSQARAISLVQRSESLPRHNSHKTKVQRLEPVLAYQVSFKLRWRSHELLSHPPAPPNCPINAQCSMSSGLNGCGNNETTPGDFDLVPRKCNQSRQGQSEVSRSSIQPVYCYTNGWKRNTQWKGYVVTQCSAGSCESKSVSVWSWHHGLGVVMPL
jgi:hypothetical protein